MNSGSSEFRAGQVAQQEYVRAQLADLPSGRAGDPALSTSDRYPNTHLPSSYRLGYPALQTLMELPKEVGTPLAGDAHANTAFRESLARIGYLVPPANAIAEAKSDERKLGMGALCILAAGRVAGATVQEAIDQIHETRREQVHGSCVVSAYCPVFRAPGATKQSARITSSRPTLQVPASTLQAMRNHIEGLAGMPTPSESLPVRRKQ